MYYFTEEVPNQVIFSSNGHSLWMMLFLLLPMISETCQEMESLTWGSLKATDQEKWTVPIKMLNFERPF